MSRPFLVYPEVAAFLRRPALSRLRLPANCARPAQLAAALTFLQGSRAFLDLRAVRPSLVRRGGLQIIEND